MTKILTRALLSKRQPAVSMPANLRLADHVREIGAQENGHRVYEFVGTDTFGAEWQTRQRYEVDAGRDEEPLLYAPIYQEIRDASLPKNVNINKIGPGGVVFEEVLEGGEVKFSTVASSEQTVRIRHYATGLEYSKDLVVFNELWNVGIVERQMGIAHNALLNHLHLYPILSYGYAAANQTSANTGGTDLVEDYFLTLEDAIVAAKTDATNPRRGPYVLLINPAQMFIVERMLGRVPQQGFGRQSSAIEMIRAVVAYDGWSGTRGNISVTYPGVTSGKAYLISLQYQGQDFTSWIKQDLAMHGMEENISRFLTQVVWDSYMGVYANPLRSTEEITWPTA